MTKQEIKTVVELFISWNDEDAPIDTSNLDGAVDYINECLSTSLPSNLDEAAKKEIERFCSDMLNVDIIWARMPLTKRFGLQMAKFGAEWMAGQGESVEGVFRAVDPGYPDVRMGEQYSIEHILRKPDGIEPGDNVVVQIRKK